MDDDEFGADADFLSALAETPVPATRIQQLEPAPQRVSQPTPQRIAAPTPGTSSSSTAPKPVQLTPQALPAKGSGSSILVSPRQKGNPILSSLRALPWEYSDIPADYILGATTCALFLSLKYHRLHPDYIYTRMRSLGGKYLLRILLVLVDIANHEDSIKELSKTSLINNVTVILCWSASEAARYLELYKSYEHAQKGQGIRENKGEGWAEKVVEFCTTPRVVNKTDAVSLVAAFGSVRGAVNARVEEIAVVPGWGEKKCRRWCQVVEEGFRNKRAAKRQRKTNSNVQGEGSGGDALDKAVRLSRVPLREMGEAARKETESGAEVAGEKAKEAEKEKPKQFQMWDPDDDDDEDEEAMIAAAIAEEYKLSQKTGASQQSQPPKPLEKPTQPAEELSDGIAAALARLRKEP